MDKAFTGILEKIVAERGKGDLLNPSICKGLLADYANKYQKERRLLLLALDAGMLNAIDTAQDIALCKTQQARRLQEDYFIAADIAADLADALALVLRGDTSKTSPPVPQSQETPPVPGPGGTVKAGDSIPFGQYEWLVLEVRNDKALILSKDIIQQLPYNADNIDVTWETCTLRHYLNNHFARKKFTDEQQRRIAETTITNPDNLWYGTKGGNDTKDKMFLLSLEEADECFGANGDYLYKMRKDYGGKAESDGIWFSNSYDTGRVAKYGNEAGWWWLRSPGNYSINAANVYGGGRVNVHGYGVNSNGGVRPALWLHL